MTSYRQLNILLRFTPAFTLVFRVSPIFTANFFWDTHSPVYIDRFPNQDWGWWSLAIPRSLFHVSTQDPRWLFKSLWIEYRLSKMQVESIKSSSNCSITTKFSLSPKVTVLKLKCVKLEKLSWGERQIEFGKEESFEARMGSKETWNRECLLASGCQTGTLQLQTEEKGDGTGSGKLSIYNSLLEQCLNFKEAAIQLVHCF